MDSNRPRLPPRAEITVPSRRYATSIMGVSDGPAEETRGAKACNDQQAKRLECSDLYAAR